MAANHQGVDQLHIKHHGLCNSDTSWQYVMAPCVTNSPVAAMLAAMELRGL